MVALVGSAGEKRFWVDMHKARREIGTARSRMQAARGKGKQGKKREKGGAKLLKVPGAKLGFVQTRKLLQPNDLWRGLARRLWRKKPRSLAQGW
jgi:hypothetical protein